MHFGNSKGILFDQSGQDSVEYAALAALGVIIAIVMYQILKPKVREKANQMTW